MFKSISWHEYLLTTGLLAAGYYVVIFSVFYSKEIVLRLKGETVPKIKPLEPVEQERKPGLMGSISNPARKKIPLKKSVAQSEELTFESDPEEMLLAQREDSPAVELIDCLDDLFTTLLVDKADKAKYIVNIRKLFHRYSEHNKPAIKQDIYGFIQDSRNERDVSFTIEELDTLWLDENEEVIHQSTTKNNHEK
jgi:peroxiredoxin family protein